MRTQKTQAFVIVAQTKKQVKLELCAGEGFGNLTQASVIWEERTSTRERPLPDWPVEKSVE